MKARKKSPPCSEHDGDRNLNNHEKALFCIIQQTGPKSKEEHMPREKEGYRAQLEFLVTLCPGVASVDIKTCTKLLGCERHTLLNDKTFPAKKVGGKYIVPLSELARWMC